MHSFLDLFYVSTHKHSHTESLGPCAVEKRGVARDMFLGSRPGEMLVSGHWGCAGATLDRHLQRTITGKFDIHDVLFQIHMDRVIRSED